MAVYCEDELVAVLVIIRMFVSPLPVFRLFFSLQLGEFPMAFVLSLLPGLVGTAFVVVPGMAILTVAVVVSLVGAVVIFVFSLDAHGRNQGRTQQKRTKIPMQSLHVFLLRRDFIMLSTRWFRLYDTNLGQDCAMLNTSAFSFAGNAKGRALGACSRFGHLDGYAIVLSLSAAMKSTGLFTDGRLRATSKPMIRYSGRQRLYRPSGRLKRPFCVCSYNQHGAEWFASQDTCFLEDWSCSGLRSRAGFILAGALRGLLRARS